MILNRRHAGPAQMWLEMYEGTFFMVIISDTGTTIYTNWVGVQECNDLLKIYLPIIHEKSTTPHGERILHNMLSFKFTLSHASRNFPQTLFSELITAPLCPQTSLVYLSQSTWVTRYWSLLFTCVCLYIFTTNTQVAP